MPKKVKRILNCIPSEKKEADWTYENAIEAQISAVQYLSKKIHLPKAVDLRENWWTIGDQESTGACVGWAVADSVLRWHFVKANRLQPNELLSVRFIWMAAKETDELISRPTTFIDGPGAGTSLKAALDITRNFGVVKDSNLPFKKGKLYVGDVKTFYAIAAKLKIVSYFNLGINVEKWREWLAFQGPILTRLDVDDTWNDAKKTGGKLDNFHRPKEPAGHAIALVGYTQDRFIVRNSWGTEKWGDAGFGYASIDYAQEAFNEAYGVTICREEKLIMDPITLAITAALGNLGATVINDAYNALKTALQEKYGVESDLVDAVDKLEKKPNSESRRGVLQEEITANEADKDKELLKIAQSLVDAVKSQPGGEQVVHQVVTGNYNIFSGSGDVTVNQS